MKEQKKLTIQMGLFTFIIFVSFGVIILNEKVAPLFSPRIDQKLNKYLKENYTSIINELDIGKTNYNNTEYQLKISFKENSNLYFYIRYSDKKITDTYKEDYLEGKNLLSKIEEKTEKELKEKYNKSFKVSLLKPLNEYSDKVKKQLINEESILSLPIYTLEIELTCNWNKSDIVKGITSLFNSFQLDEVNPNNYSFIIKDKKTNKKIKINNLTKEIIIDEEKLTNIIDKVLTNDTDNVLEENNITYEKIKEN